MMEKMGEGMTARMAMQNLIAAPEKGRKGRDDGWPEVGNSEGK